jgi:hypothetical protein
MTDFPRGGARPPQAVSKAASIALIVVSIGVIVGALLLLSWAFV